MRFFFISDDIFPFLEKFKKSRIVGGAEKQQYLLIKELLNRKHEVLICTNADHDPELSNFQLWRLPSEKRFLKYLALLNKLIYFKPDVIYLRSPSNLGAVLVLYAKVFRKKMTFFAAHDTDFDPAVNLQGYKPYLHWIAMKGANFIFCQNENQLNLLKRYYNRSGYKLGNIIDIDVNLDKMGDDRSYFLWVGRIESFKRIELIIEIAKKMKAQNFLVVAPDNVKDSYSAGIKERLQKVSNIIYLDFVKPDEIHRYYAGAIALINTSKYEGFPNTFLEAFINGTPVYSLGVDPNSIIRESSGKLGFVYPTIIELIINIEKVLPLADSDFMRSYVVENHSIKRNVSKYFDIINGRFHG